MASRPIWGATAGVAATPWLFPSSRPGRHLGPKFIMTRLRTSASTYSQHETPRCKASSSKPRHPWSPSSSATATTPPSATRKSQPSRGPATSPKKPPIELTRDLIQSVLQRFWAIAATHQQNGTASPQSDDIDATPGTEPRRSGTIRLAILKPWHLPDTTEYGAIEYGGLPVNCCSDVVLIQ